MIYDSDMADSSNRYANLDTKQNNNVVQLCRRFLLLSDQEPGVEVPANTSNKQYELTERVDQLAFQHLNDPLFYWRIADVNKVLHPLELLELKQLIKP